MFRHEIKSGRKGSGFDNAQYVAREGKYRHLGGLVHLEFGNLPKFAPDPFFLFRAADNHERRNGSVYREHLITLPQGLTRDQYIEIARELAKDLAGPRPTILAIHDKESSIEQVENPHLHLVTSDRIPDGIERSAKQHFKRAHPTRPELGGCKKHSGGLEPVLIREQAKQQRQTTERILNRKLAEYGRSDRVDARSLKDQGIKRSPERPLGKARIDRMTPTERQAYVEARHRTRRGDRPAGE